MDTISTSLPEKLPEAVRGLLEEARPLPPGVTLFEQRFTLALSMKRIGFALALFLVAAVLFLDGLYTLYHYEHRYGGKFAVEELVAGAVCVYGGWLMLSSVLAGRTLRRRQAAGERTRYGIFLLPEALVSRSQFDTTVIPRENFRGLDGGKVKYLAKNEPKSFTLPGEWVGASPAEVAQAITVWSQTATPPATTV